MTFDDRVSEVVESSGLVAMLCGDPWEGFRISKLENISEKPLPARAVYLK
jgi:hypothetical protein